MPFFSIIIPTYNRAHTIRRPVDSILAQTFTDWELIIVDDGSSDYTKDVICAFDDKRIRYFWQKNRGRSASRNTGFSLAKGEWICFLDSDDEFLENHLESFYKEINKKSEFKAFRTGLICINPNGKETRSKFSKDKRFTNSYPYDHIVVFAFHRSIMDKYKFDERFSYMEDMHFLLRCNVDFPFYQIDKHTYIYHIDPYRTGRLSQDFDQIIWNKNQCIDDMLLFPLNPIRKLLIWTKITNGFIHMYGSLKYNRKLLFKSLKLNCNNFFSYPSKFLQVICRIFQVKVREMFGYHFENFRF
jgi:glycosyltransferase involved in cell wall biosynthesis